MSNATTMSGVKPFNSFMDYTKLDRNRQRTVVFYGRVSTEHEAQLSALENQMQWYSDQAKYHPNWNVIGPMSILWTQKVEHFLSA